MQVFFVDSNLFKYANILYRAATRVYIHHFIPQHVGS